MVTFEIKPGYFTIHDGKTAYDFCIDNVKRQALHFPGMDYIYDLCRKQGMSPGETIDTMLKVFHRDRLVKRGYLKALSIVIGLLGMRGSGKSVGAAAIAILDFLLDGKTVWSNMGIELAVRYRDCEKIFASEPLDKASLMDINDFEQLYANGLVIVDEINIEIGDAKRSMSNSMLWFDFALQEVRKRHMNVMYQLQSEDWAGNRTQFQTDIYVTCKDAAFKPGIPPKAHNIGRLSHWKIHDMSGVITGEIKYADKFRHKVEPFREHDFWNTPFWNCYNTGQFQKHDKFDPTKAKTADSQPFTIDENQFKALTAGYNVLPDVILRLLSSNIKQVPHETVWELLKVTDHREKIRIGQLLLSLGCTSYQGADGKRGYRLPEIEALHAKLNEMGLSTWRKENG